MRGAPAVDGDPLCAQLRAIGAENALEALLRECVDLDALSLLGEEELREIGVPLGPRVKILHSGLARTPRRHRANSEAARESRTWNMEAVTDVEALQQAARPRMCMNVQSGRVARMADGIRNAGILANEEDMPFVVLMGQDEGSFYLQAQGEQLQEVVVSAAAASCSPPFLSSLTDAQRTVLEQVVRQMWQPSTEEGDEGEHCQESDREERTRRSATRAAGAAEQGDVSGPEAGSGPESLFAFDAFPPKERLSGELTKQLVLQSPHLSKQLVQQSPLIVVFDGVGTPALHRSVCETFFQTGMWTWGHSSLGSSAPSRHDAVFWKCDQDALRRSSAVMHLTALVLKLASSAVGKELVLQRVYANGHTFGQGGSMHVDEDGIENYAAIYYANLHWLPQWLGHTHYLPGTLSHLQNDTDQGLDMSVAVLPKAQRLCLHDGRQCHVGTPPHRSFTGLRVTLAWKFAVNKN
jgi:hypothetical protein